jgi:ABC-type transport system substrate-binding protein
MTAHHSPALLERPSVEPSEPGIRRRDVVVRGSVLAMSFSSLSAFLAACGGEPGTKTPAAAKPPSKPTGTLRVANSTEIQHLDPAYALATDVWVINAVYEGLARFDPEFKRILPLLATSWEHSDDQREWIFNLREGVKFHDGEAFDAEAVKKTRQYVKAQKAGLPSNLVPDFQEIVRRIR